MSATRWGDTAPFLKIAQHFNVDYSVTLALGDYWLRSRPFTFTRSVVPFDDQWDALMSACYRQAERMRALWAGAPL